MMINPYKVDKNPYYQLLRNPSVYLNNLIYQTISIGIFTLCICSIVYALDFEYYAFPSNTHSLVGFIIGLLLVFRTNTAYDRWWDGRKIIGNMHSEVSLIIARLNVINSTTENNIDDINKIKAKLSDFLVLLCAYLTSGRNMDKTKIVNAYHNKLIEDMLILLSKIDKTDPNISHLNSSISNIMNYSIQLSRIKNTPIPVAYVYHIKVSILIYLVTLPFGMFHDLGLWSIPLIMLIYFIIAGVEIISSEIENPFHGDPNDLPTEDLFESMVEIIEKDY